MNRITKSCRVGVCLAVLSVSAVADTNWPQWRGPLGTGEAPNANPPIEWSEEQNVRWKIEIPGWGHATPVLWGERLYALSSLRTDDATNRHQFLVFAINRADGSIAWRKVAREESPHAGIHETGTRASNSAVTDGEFLYAYFGSHGLYCYDMDGNLKWEKDFGDMRIKNSFGEGSSPALDGDRLILNWDHEGESFIVALDKRTGDEIWRKSRDEGTSWATPLIVQAGDSKQVITNATRQVRSYDFATGELLWQCSGMTANTIPTPVSDGSLVYLMSGFRGNALLAVRLEKASGDLNASDAIAWSYDRDTPYVPSPLLYQGHLYFLKSNGNLLSCFDAATGESKYTTVRLEGLRTIYASPLAASGRVYIVDREGTVAVLQSGGEFHVLALNKLDDGFSASPVAVGGELYLRGTRYLYCIAQP